LHELYLNFYFLWQVLSIERFEHVGFLIQFGGKGSETIPLSQAAPFFANSDPDMPAAAVSAAQVHDWLLQKIADSLDRLAEKAGAKENGPSSGPDQDVAMTDVNAGSTKASTASKGLTFIEGISKSSYVKQAAEVKGSSLKVGMRNYVGLVCVVSLGMLDFVLFYGFFYLGEGVLKFVAD